MIASNSDQEQRIEKVHLPAGTISVFMGRLAGMKVKKNLLGRCNSFQLEGNNKVLKVFTSCRIPESTTPGILKSKAQHDRSSGEVKTSREHREDVLKQLSEGIWK